MKIKKERTPQQIINKQKKKIKQLNEVIVELRKENLKLKMELNEWNNSPQKNKNN